MMDIVFKMMDFVFKMMNFVLKSGKFAHPMSEQHKYDEWHQAGPERGVRTPELKTS